MGSFLNKNAEGLRQGAIRALFDRASAMKDTINFGIGEPDLDTPQNVVDAGCNALRNGYTHYTQNAGIPQLRKAVSDYLGGFGVESVYNENIIVTAGGMGALSLCLLCTISPGDEVIVQSPQWLNYRSQIVFAGGVPVSVPVEEREGFSLKAEGILKRVTDKTRIIMLNSPNNPTGAVLSESDLKEIAGIAIKHDLLVISDEVYCEILYDGYRHHSIAAVDGMKERALVVNSLSKSFAMTGWRVGFAAGPASIISKMIVLQENMIACVSSIAQHAAVEALTNRGFIEEMRAIYDERRHCMVDGLNAIPGITCIKPHGSFYAFPNITALNVSSKDFCEGLLNETGVISVPGSAFGEAGEGYVRFSYANSVENIQKGLGRIEAYVARLR